MPALLASADTLAARGAVHVSFIYIWQMTRSVLCVVALTFQVWGKVGGAACP